MKKYISKLLLLAVLAVAGVSCEEDEAVTTLAEVGFSGPVIASPHTIVLTPENKYLTVTNISWPHVEFPVDAPVTYALQIDIPTDTIGTTAWDNATRIAVGDDVLSKSFLGVNLNEMAIDLGLATDVPGELVVRVEATMDRTIYSKAIVLTVTPFIQPIVFGQLLMPGTYNSFNLNNAATLSAIDSGVYQGYMTFPTGQLQFNFATDSSGSQMYGADGAGNFAEGGTANLSVPAAGSYQITVNLNTMSFTAVPYSWGVIGTATAGGWNSDTDMFYDYQNHVWKFVGSLVPGALKFRLNDSWTINYGPNNNSDTVVYLDNPGAYTIPEAGTYEVTFAYDAANPATVPYTVVQQ